MNTQGQSSRKTTPKVILFWVSNNMDHTIAKHGRKCGTNEQQEQQMIPAIVQPRQLTLE